MISRDMTTEPETSIVSSAFYLLAKSTELSLGEYTSITQSQADIERYLVQYLDTFSTVVFGAFSRKTIVSPLHGSIVDMLVLFREADAKQVMPSRLFSHLYDALIEQYPDTYKLENRNVLVLVVNGFHYRIQPAYPVSAHVYMLPDEKFNDWARYDIASYNEIFSKQNVRHKGRLIDIIRIIKTWNRVSGNFFNGYYLELLVTEVLSDHEITSYQEALRHIFRTAVAKVVFQQHDPANMEFQVEGLNDISDLIKVMKLLQKCFHLANEAVMHEHDNNTKMALDNWNLIFPGVFPSHVDMVVGRARSAGVKGADALRMMINSSH